MNLEDKGESRPMEQREHERNLRQQEKTGQHSPNGSYSTHFPETPFFRVEKLLFFDILQMGL